MKNEKIKNEKMKNEKINILIYAKKIYSNLHLLNSQLFIKEYNKHKSAIFAIYNLITKESYIDCAINNRIYSQFKIHCINLNGNKLVKKAIDKFGLSNFQFIIIEYYPGLILKENLNKEHKKLLLLKSFYLDLFKPFYNLNYSIIDDQINNQIDNKINTKIDNKIDNKIDSLANQLDIKNSNQLIQIKKLFSKNNPLIPITPIFSQPIELIDITTNKKINYKSIREVSKE